MRVLHVISGGDTGGGKTHVLTLVSELQKRVPARIMCFMEGPFSREARDMGLDIEVAVQHGRQDLSVIRSLVRLVREESTDIVHSHGARANFLTVLAKPRLKVPFVTTVHSDYRRDFTDSLYKRLVYTSLNSVALRFFDHYIVVSEPLRKILNQRGIADDRIHSVRNYLARPVEHQGKERFLEQHGLERLSGDPLVGALGRLHQVKGQAVLVRAASMVRERFPKVRFLLGGDGPALDDLQSLVTSLGLKDHVFFLGYITNPYDFLNALDIHVLPSLSETFPYVILEAAALGVPTVSTDVGSIAELVTPGDTGLLVPPGDPAALAAAVLELLGDPGQARQLGDRLRQAAEPYFSPPAMAQRHLEIYEQILEGKTRRR